MASSWFARRGTTDGLTPSPTAGASNEGFGTNYGSIECPGNDPYVITVGAMKSEDGSRSDDRIATYSSRGPSAVDFVLKPDIMAPGNQVISVEQPKAFLEQTYQTTNEVPCVDYMRCKNSSQVSNNYFMLSGTSMATPVVSAAAAMLLQQNPSLSPDTIKLRLLATADKWADPQGNADACSYGAGYINIPAACASTLVATGSSMSPYLTLDSSGDVFANFYGNVNWDRAISGFSNLGWLRTIWGEHAIAGNDTLSSSHAISGTGFWFNTNRVSVQSAGVDLSAQSVPIQGER